jgi:hypothetical protein
MDLKFGLKKKQEEKIETVEITFLRVAAVTQGRPNRNAKIIEEVNILNSNNKITKSGSQSKYHVLQNRRHNEFRRKFNIQAKKKTTRHENPQLR